MTSIDYQYYFCSWIYYLGWPRVYCNQYVKNCFSKQNLKINDASVVVMNRDTIKMEMRFDIQRISLIIINEKIS
jgi:hypothetical protein